LKAGLRMDAATVDKQLPHFLLRLYMEIRNSSVSELEFVTAFNYQKHSAEAVQQILKSCPSQGDDALATCSKGPSYGVGWSAAPRGALDTQPDPVANNAAVDMHDTGS
jgi:hypothetical protein